MAMSMSRSPGFPEEKKPMLSIRSSNQSLVLLFAFGLTMLTACSAERQFEQSEPNGSATPGKLGTVDFPTSCSQPAQARFLRGVAALHSFWYPVALDEFRETTKIERDCMMGYWGEAMAHNHPIWGDPQETEAARKTLEKIKDSPKLTPRERAYLQAVRILYGEGDKPVRDGKNLSRLSGRRGGGALLCALIDGNCPRGRSVQYADPVARG
jgi:hypothetical protein